MSSKRHIPFIALLMAIVAVGGMAQLGGFTGPVGSTGDADETAVACPVQAQSDAVAPGQQDPQLVTQKWQQPHEASADDLKAATVAVEADVVDVSSAGGEPPHMAVTLNVCTTILGEAAGQVVVMTRGDGERHRVGDPFYAVGERYVLYLQPSDVKAGAFETVGPSGRHLIKPDGAAESTGF